MPTVCKKCELPISYSGEAWVVIDPTTTADGLSYCPPDPDRDPNGDHEPKATWTVEPLRTGKPCAYCTDLTTHNVGNIGVCDPHITRANNNLKRMLESA